MNREILLSLLKENGQHQRLFMFFSEVTYLNSMYDSLFAGLVASLSVGRKGVLRHIIVAFHP